MADTTHRPLRRPDLCALRDLLQITAHTPLLEGVLFLPQLLGRWNFLRRACDCSTSDARISAFISRVSTFRAYCFLRIRDVRSALFLRLFVHESTRDPVAPLYVYSALFDFVLGFVARTLKLT